LKILPPRPNNFTPVFQTYASYPALLNLILGKLVHNFTPIIARLAVSRVGPWKSALLHHPDLILKV